MTQLAAPVASRHTTAWLHLELHSRTTALTHVPRDQTNRERLPRKRALQCRRSGGQPVLDVFHKGSRQLVERPLSGTNFRKCGTAVHISSTPTAAVQRMDNGWRSKSPGRASEAPTRAPAFRSADLATFWLWPTDELVTSFPKSCWAQADP